MKNTRKLFEFATIIAVFAFSSAVCFGQSSGRTINSAKALEEYLDNQPANSPNNPIKVTMSANEPMMKDIAKAINSAGKYVSLTLSGNVLTNIPEYAFSNCKNLISITIPNSVTGIGANAFNGCTSLTGVTIPNSVTSIGAQAFQKCTSLKNVTIPNSVTTIEGHAFMDCTGLTSITIPNSVTTIKGGYDYSGTFSGCTNLASVTIGNGVTSIGDFAFWNCRSLKNVTIPNNVTSIGEGAFIGVTSVTFQGTTTMFKGVIAIYNPGDWRFGEEGFYTHSNGTFGGDLLEKYLAGGIGTYTRASGDSTWTKQHQTTIQSPQIRGEEDDKIPSFPPDFIGIWKRDNFNNTLTFTATTVKSSSRDNFWNFINKSGDAYTLESNTAAKSRMTLTFRLVSGNIIISGDSGNGENNWNGTWRKQQQQAPTQASQAGGTVGGKLAIWSFTDELANIINTPTWGFKRTHPGVDVEYSQTPSDQFQAKIDPVLASGQGAPDIIALESAFIRKYVESGLLLDITDVYEANKAKLFSYPVEIGTYNGKVYAMSWQASPGAMFYRRSLAKKYLGTDDPKVVQTYFNSFPKFLETAQLLNQRSNGSCMVISSLGDLRNPFLYARRNPWIVNGRVEVDPAMEQYMDLCKTLRDNRLEGRVDQWSEGWFAGMKGELRDESRRAVEVFSYFLPTWGLHYVLKTNAPGTSGDWAMIQGPSSYRWGGTWVGAYKGTKNVTTAKEFIRYVTTDDVFLEAWAKNTGDLVSNINVINKIKDTYSEPFLGGQNHYAEFAEMAKGVNGKLLQGSDEAIEAMFDKAVSAFINGEKTKAKALDDFKRQANSQFGQ